MGIKPIQRVHVGEQVFEQLKKLLIQGEWKQGEKIPSENELADMFGVSRITIRQALQKLSTLGLIETKLGEGSFVKKVDVGDNMNLLIPTVYLGENSNMQVFEFREIIDAEAAGLAALRADQKGIERLREILDQMIDSAEKDDSKEFARQDLEFHMQIGKMTGNSLIIQTNHILREILMKSMEDVIKRMGYIGVHYHELILDAIEKRDRKRAMDLMREHIYKNMEYFEDESQKKAE